MSKPRTYDPKQVKVIVGVAILSGFAEDTMVTVERDEDAFTKMVGVDGETSRAKSNNRGGTAKITLAQTSPSNDLLSGIAVLDEIKSAGVVPFTIKDLSGTSTYVSAYAWVKKLPASEYGKKVGNREWTLDLADVDVFVGGNVIL
jgi:hypothetical protein